MIDHPLLLLLRTLDRDQFKKLQNFLKSPYFNKNKDVEKLAAILAKEFPELNNAKRLAVRALHKKVYPSKAFKLDRMPKLFLALSKLVDQFVAFERAQDRELDNRVNLLHYYHDAALSQHFDKSLKKCEQILQNLGTKGDKDYLNKHWIGLLSVRYQSSTNELDKGQRLNEAYLHLQTFYLISILRLHCLSYNHKHVANYEASELNTELVLKQAGSSPFNQVLLIKAYYHTILFLRDQERDDSFKTVKEIIEKGELEDHPEDQKLLYDSASNFCALRIMNQQEQYQGELFELYQFALKKGLLYLNGYLFPNTIKNIVTLALWLKEFDWVENFIEHYKERIEPEFREQIYSYNRANVLFHTGQFDKARDLLELASYKDIYYQLSARRLFIKICYEQQEISLLESLVQSFYMFIYRDDLVASPAIESNRNFINLLKSTINTAPGDQDRYQKLLNKLQESGRMIERRWLKEKLSALAGE